MVPAAAHNRLGTAAAAWCAGMSVGLRRSARIRTQLDTIEQKLTHLLELTHELNVEETELSVRLELFMGCHEEISDIMSAVHANVDRCPPSSLRKKEYGPILDSFDDVIGWIGKETEDIIKIIGQVAVYADPANLGRRREPAPFARIPRHLSAPGAPQCLCGGSRARHLLRRMLHRMVYPGRRHLSRVPPTTQKTLRLSPYFYSSSTTSCSCIETTP